MLHISQDNFSSILQAAQEGNEKAYNQFLHECTDLLRIRLGRWVKRNEIREEIIQEVLIGVHRNLHTYLPERLNSTRT